MTVKTFLLIVLLLVSACSQTGTGSLQVTPNTPTLFTNTTYLVSYYTLYNLPPSATFFIDFSSSYIGVPNATLNISSTINSLPANGATGSCLASKCTLRLNNNAAPNSNIQFIIGNLLNPPFLMQQTTNFKVTFNATYSQANNWTINSILYTPQPMKINSMKQSDYGVGNTDVTYSFNFTVPMTPNNPQLSITIPSQVGIGNLQTALSFYGSIQNGVPVYISNLIIFAVVTAASNSTNSSGFVYLTISGLTNPQSMGNSSSFIIQLLTTTLPGTSTSCTNCLVAQVNSMLIAQSTVPGNIATINFLSSNTLIGQTNTLTIYSQLYASIPAGGMYIIILPTSITPVLPVNCSNDYGFTLTSGSKPSCSFNASNNAISTNNFMFSSIGSVVIKVTVINPPDTRTVPLWFRTYDANGNMIGNSTAPYLFSAAPLTLNSTVQKNSTQVDTAFKLTVNLTLQITLQSTDLLKVVLPQANYVNTAIICSSAGINIPCTPSIDNSTGNLTITMSPPCSQCTNGSSLSFIVDGLLNPSFINSYSQTVIVQTARTTGVIESSATPITLTPSLLTISNYARTGNNTVGSTYSMSFNYTTSPYVSTNGGQFVINFNQYDSYANIIYDSPSQTYDYPSSLIVTDTAGNSYSNSLSYYSTGSPTSLQQIVIQICGPSSSCTGSLNVQGLRKSFSPVSNLTQNMQITTFYNDQIATTTFSATQYNTVKTTKSLGISLSNSVATLNSNYVLTFLSANLPFQPVLSFSITQGSINGGCFATHNSTIFLGVFNCQVVNTSVVSLSFTGDNAPMMIDTILYTVTLTNVANPLTIAPLPYYLTTQFNNLPSQQFSTTYSIQNALPLSFSYSLTNNTLGQPAVLNLTITSLYPSFNEIIMNIPVGLLSVSAGSYQSAVVNNNYQINQIYSLNNNSVQLNIVNPTSTSISGNFTLSMFSAGYLSASGTITIAPVLPVYLGLTATLSSRVVGAFSQMTVNFNRVNPYSSQSLFFFNLTNTLFDFSTALYNNSALVLPISLPIGITSLTITNLKNLLYIPNTPPANSISAWTVDSVGFKIAVSPYSAAPLIPNLPAVGSKYGFTRTSTAINGLGSLNINYIPSFPTLANIMTITMPVNQTSIVSPGCTMQGATNNAVNCLILSSNTTSMTIYYLNQSTTTLTNVLNLEPNNNPLQVNLLTANNELIESTNAQITPSIQYNQLTVTGNSSTLAVATNAQLLFNLAAANPIDIGSKIVITFPINTFTRISSLISQNCSYIVSGTTYSSCQYGMNGSWVTQVNLTYLGPTLIPSNTPLSVNLALTNAWTSTLFASNVVVFYVNSPTDNFVAQGVISLISLYGGQGSLAATNINSLAVSQTSSIAATANSLNFTFSLSVPIAQSSTIVIGIPKSTYKMILSNTATLSNLNVTATSEDTSFYLISLLLRCSQTGPLCNLANYQYSFTLNLNNNLYVQNQQDQPTLQVLLSSQTVTAVTNANIPLYTAQTMTNPTISRSNSNAYQPTNITIGITLPTLNVTSFSIVISPLITPSGNSALLNSLTYVGLSATQSLTYTLNASYYITIALSGQTGTLNILLTGANNPLVSIAPEIYTLAIGDSNYVYYTASLTPPNKIVPYGNGLTLQRITTTVGASTNVYINGNLPANIPSMSVLFNGYNVAVTGQSFNISLGTILNSINVSDTSTVPITIKNADYIAYSNSLPYTPTLTPQNLTAFVSLQLPSTIYINQNISASLSLSNTSLSYLSISLPPFFQSLNFCCIDSSCSQNNIVNCSYSTTSNSLIQIYLKGSQIVSNITVGLSSLSYQATFPNSKVTVTSALPSASFTFNYNLSVLALSMSSTLLLSNWQVNTPNTYTLNIQTIARVGSLVIVPPSFISTQLLATNTPSTSTLTINGTPKTFSLTNNQGQSSILLPMDGTKSNITLTMNSITNPINNQPYSFVVQQAQDLSLTYIYGYNNISFSMKIFDPITLSSAVRNVTKVGMATTVIMNITTPSYTDQMIITFPASQLFTTTNCQITSSSSNLLPCSVLSSNSILTNNVPGNATYTVTGMVNQMAFDSTTTNDLITVTIGNPYTRASTVSTTTTYINPQLTMGAITLNAVSSSNFVALSTTTLTYNVSLQNYQNINGFVLQFTDAYYYVIPPNVACKINNLPVACLPISTSQLYIQSTASPSPQQTVISVANIINYIRPTTWVLMSVKTQTAADGLIKYSNVDLYSSNGVGNTVITPMQLTYRLILPYNYVQSSPTTITVLIDSPINSYLPTASLNFKLDAQGIACSSSGVTFSNSLSLPCTLNDTRNVGFSLQLYHNDFPTVTLATGTSNMFIYPSPTSNCNNQMCDSCSSSNGQEYCFACRQGLYSSNGQCQSNCNSGFFPYGNTNICQPCSPTCTNCFGVFLNQCLTCSDTTLVLNSGTCQKDCPGGSYSYNSNCVSSPQCQSVSGCRVCSNSGFCYQCLPNYNGAPTCKYSNVMPPTIMIYILAPFAILALIPLFIVAFRCLGVDSLLSQSIFSFSLIELFAWALTVPIMNDISTAMVLVSFFTLRIIISIVSYEVFYKKNLGELSQKLLEDESQKDIDSKQKNQQTEKTPLNNWKTKLVRFLAHFNGPDSYELLQSRISEPVLAVNHSLPIQIIFMLNRWIVSVLMVYMLSLATVGDSVFMPAIIVALASLLSLCRLLTWDKFKACLSKCRQ